MPSFSDNPGLLYVAATLIPLLSFVAILTVGGLKNLGRTYKESAWGSSLYWLLGGDRPGTHRGVCRHWRHRPFLCPQRHRARSISRRIPCRESSR